MRRSIMKRVLIMVLYACLASGVRAAPFSQMIEFTQPDGTAIKLNGWGDDFQAVFEDADGYTVVYVPNERAYYYAIVSADGTQLVPTALMVGVGDPASLGVETHLRISSTAAQAQAQERYQKWDEQMGVSERWRTLKDQRRAIEVATASGVELAPPSYTTTGVKVGLCLLIDFSDDVATITRSQVESFCNGDNYTGFGNHGSVKQYYLDNSNNLLTYTNVVTVYVRVPHPKSFYNDTSRDCGENANDLIKDALDALKALPNYTSEILPSFASLSLDSSNRAIAFNVFYAGGNGGTWMFGLWPHSWSLYSAGAQKLSDDGPTLFKYQITNIGSSLTLGTFCHENGHMLCGYPDLYDYNYDSTGGAGDFCLMGYGGSGGNPSQICAYLKYASGWTTTVEVDNKTALTAQLVSTVGAEGFNRIYRYAKPGTETEYYLFETRQKAGRDASLPCSGVAIWHIDEAGNRDDQRYDYNSLHHNYECTLMQADNLWDFENYVNSGDADDLFYQGNGAAAYTGLFNDNSTPSAKWWDGSVSGMQVRNISAPGTNMTFAFVLSPPVILTGSVLPDGRIGMSYSYTLRAASGKMPYTWSLVSGSLPSGLDMGADGIISGLPDVATVSTFSIAVMDDNLFACTNTFSLTIHSAFTVPYTQTFENGGNLPDGWSRDTLSGSTDWAFGTGTPKGVPGSAHNGSYNAYFAVPASGPCARLITPAIDFGSSAPFGRLQFWHYMAPWVSDQDELRVYYKTAPSGVWTEVAAFTSAVTGWTLQTVDVPNPSSTTYFAFEGTSKYGYGICVDDVEISNPSASLAFTTGSTLIVTKDSLYNQTLTATGGISPYAFSLASGTLPDGFTFSADGSISGTATNTGIYPFAAALTDAEGAAVTNSFTLVVELTRVTLFSEDFEHDGVMPSDWSQSYVTNTVGWTVSQGGKLGHPKTTAEGNNNAFFWSGAWVNGASFDQKTMLISPRINCGQDPKNVRLSFSLCMQEWDGGQDELRIYYRTNAVSAWLPLASFTSNVTAWTYETVALPNPTATYYLAFEGNALFGYGICLDDIRVSDTSEAPLILTPSPLTYGEVDVEYNTTLVAAGGLADYTWSVVSGSLPSGLGLDPNTGTISGTPTISGTFSFSVRVTGSDGKFSVSQFVLQIQGARTLPFRENFESGRELPQGWKTVLESGESNWVLRCGSPSGVPSSAYEGSNNACLYYGSKIAFASWLVTPTINLGTSTNAQLSFMHCMAKYVGDLDSLAVYYKTSSTSDWVFITNFTTEVAVWTNQVIILPNPTSSYIIGFRGTTMFGHGICIDNVSVTGATPYDNWLAATFTPTEITAGVNLGTSDDFDGDGIINALEYAYGLDPHVADTVGLPYGGVADNHLFWTYRENKSATDVTFLVEACTSLVNQIWTTVDVSEFLRADSNTWYQVTTIHDIAVTNAPQRFLRLKVTVP